jgi:hypothetical protein
VPRLKEELYNLLDLLVSPKLLNDGGEGWEVIEQLFTGSRGEFPECLGPKLILPVAWQLGYDGNE